MQFLLNFKIKCDDSYVIYESQRLNSFLPMFNRLFLLLLIWIVYAYVHVRMSILVQYFKNEKNGIIICMRLLVAVGDWRFSISFACFGANHSLSIMQMKLIQGRPDKFTSGLEEWTDSLELIRFDSIRMDGRVFRNGDEKRISSNPIGSGRS